MGNWLGIHRPCWQWGEVAKERYLQAPASPSRLPPETRFSSSGRRERLPLPPESLCPLDPPGGLCVIRPSSLCPYPATEPGEGPSPAGLCREMPGHDKYLKSPQARGEVKAETRSVCPCSWGFALGAVVLFSRSLGRPLLFLLHLFSPKCMSRPQLPCHSSTPQVGAFWITCLGHCGLILQTRLVSHTADRSGNGAPCLPRQIP